MTAEQEIDLRKALAPGDVLLYTSGGFYGWVIRLKTWHPVTHAEAYAGYGRSVASRNGIGVNAYPVRVSGLTYICRPKLTQRINLREAIAWARSQYGTPYGWTDLLQFVGVNVQARGIVCSPFVTEFLRAGGLDPFNGEPADKIAPFEFLLSPIFDIYEVSPDGKVNRRPDQVPDLAS